MAHSCADNPSNFVLYHTPSAHSDASLMAISQQLLQKQSFQQQYNPSPAFCDGRSTVMADSSWPLLQTNPAHLHLSLPTSRLSSCSSDAFRDFSSGSCFFEPTSVLDHLSSPSLDSMHSPLSFTEQQIHGNDQCLPEDVCVTVPAAMSTATDCSILQEIGEFLSRKGEIADIRSANATSGYCLESTQAALRAGEKVLVDQNELGMVDISSDWMDCLVNDLQEEAREVEIASCFETNPCESAHSSLEESWPSEDFAFACSSSWTPDPAFSPDLHSLSSSHDHLFSCSNFTALSAQQQRQQRDPLQLLLIPSNCPPQENSGSAHSYQRRDAIDILSTIGILGLHLQRKCSDRGITLLQILIDFVKTVTRAGYSSRRKSLACTNAAIKLRQISSDYGDPLQRLSFYFTEAISAGLELNSSAAAKGFVWRDDSCPEDEVMAYRTLNEACPYIKFAHLTANQAILEAAEAAEKVHIIDCGIVQGVQWAALLQAFATRPADGIPRKIRITGIASPNLCSNPSASLAATGKRLTEFAMLLNLELEFCPVCSNLEDLDPSMLRLESDEVLAVNFMFQLHHLLDDSLRHLQRTLKLVHLLNPTVITVAEYEASINAPSLHTRFLNAFCFYAAVFDSMDATLARDDPDRTKVEKLFFAKEIGNLMAVEETERRESSENWRRLLERAGFWMKPLSWYATSQARLLLWLYCEKFSLMELGPGCLSLGWLEQPIVTVSAWQC